MRYIATVLFLLICAVPSFAKQRLSMEDAEKLFLENNLFVKTKQIEMNKADAGIVEAKTLSNPALKYSFESLKNSARESEKTYSVSQSIDIAGKREKRVEAAVKDKEARMFFLDHEISGLLAQLKQTYYKILLLKENEKSLAEIIAMFSAVEEKIDARVKGGDASEADLMKLTSEKKKIVRNLEGLKTEMNAEKKNLMLLLNIQLGDFDLSAALQYSPFSFSVQDLTDIALQNRHDLRGQNMAVKSAEALLSFSKREAIPLFDIEGGYKKGTGGFDGFVFAVSVPLPLFSRNQGGIARAKAELEQEKITLELMKKTVISEVNILSERITSLQSRIIDMSQHLETAKELTKIAGIAYEEGEAGILDLLDAVRSEKELAMEYNSAVYEYWAALFELEKTTGTKLTHNGGEK